MQVLLIVKMWKNIFGIINRIAQEHPILVDKYLQNVRNRGRCSM